MIPIPHQRLQLVNARVLDVEGGRYYPPQASLVLQDGDAVAVSDNGCGMSPEVQSHLFEPFFTTKEDAHSTGLGLSVVYGIVLGHQGKIEVETEPGRGTAFIITLPRQRKSELVQEPGSVPAWLPGRRQSERS